MLKLRDWYCSKCEAIEEHLTEDETPIHCNEPMTIKLSWAYRGDVHMCKEYKRRELKGQRVRDIQNKQMDSFNSKVKPWQ